jgi:hypothetical protein
MSDGSKIPKYTVEHVTPTSWFPLTSIVNEFRHARSDPVCILIAEGIDNQTRGNRPLAFSKTGPTGTFAPWANTIAHIERVAAVARIVCYTALAYPCVANSIATGSSPPSLDKSGAPGIPEYAQQIDEIVELASREPAEWELETALQVKARFGICNPLVVSERVRTALADRSSTLYALLFARLSGSALTDRALVRTIVEATGTT